MGITTHFVKQPTENNVLKEQIENVQCVNRMQTDKSCSHRFVWFISLLTFVVAFGTVNVFQLNEILTLKRRIEYLERNALVYEVSISTPIEQFKYTIEALCSFFYLLWGLLLDFLWLRYFLDLEKLSSESP